VQFFLYILYYTVIGGSIDGLRPSWQPAIIYTLLSTMYISSLANKIVVVVIVPHWSWWGQLYL